MVTYHLTGHVSAAGELHVDLPAGVPPGEVDVIISVQQVQPGDTTLSADDVQRLMQVNPLTGPEIAAMLAENEPGYQHIADSAAWVEEQRRDQKEQTRW